MNINNNTHEQQQTHTQSVRHFHRLTSHYTNVTVAIAQNFVERWLLRQTANDRRLGKRAYFLFLLYVEALHLIGETHQLSLTQRDTQKVSKDALVVKTLRVAAAT